MGLWNALFGESILQPEKAIRKMWDAVTAEDAERFIKVTEKKVACACGHRFTLGDGIRREEGSLWLYCPGCGSMLGLICPEVPGFNPNRRR